MWKCKAPNKSIWTIKNSRDSVYELKRAYRYLFRIDLSLTHSKHNYFYEFCIGDRNLFLDFTCNSPFINGSFRSEPQFSFYPMFRLVSYSKPKNARTLGLHQLFIIFVDRVATFKLTLHLLSLFRKANGQFFNGMHRPKKP